VAKQPLFRHQAISSFLKGTQPSWAGNTLYIALHHDAPFWSDSQELYEVHYDGYVRQPITAGEWSINGANATNNVQIQFPNPNGTTLDEVWWVSLGTAQTGPGQMLYYTNVFEEVFLIAVGQPIIIPVGGLTVRET